MWIKNKIKDKILDVTEKAQEKFDEKIGTFLGYNNNFDEEHLKQREEEIESYFSQYEDEEKFDFEEYKKNYNTLFLEKENIDILKLTRDLEKFKVDILDDLLENKLQEKIKTGLIFDTGYVFDEYNFNSDKFKTDINDEKFGELFKTEALFKKELPNFQAYTKDGELLYDSETRKKNDKKIEEISYSIKNDEDFFLSFYFNQVEYYSDWTDFANSADVIVVFEKKNGDTITNYSKEEYLKEIGERKKEEVINKQINEVERKLEEKTYKDTRVIKTEDFQEIRDEYAKNYRKLNRQIEKLEKENQKNKNITKEKETEIETEKNNDKEMEF